MCLIEKKIKGRAREKSSAWTHRLEQVLDEKQEGVTVSAD